jgi:cyanophycinase
MVFWWFTKSSSNLDHAMLNYFVICALLAQNPLPINGPAFTNMAPKGTLIVVGGGTTPSEATELLLVEATKRQNHLIVLPTANLNSDTSPLNTFGKPFEGKTAKVTVLHSKSREESMVAGFALPIRTASAVWILEGDQKRLAERYVGTPVETELKALLERGGCIGGTSAGAAIMSHTMIAGGNQQPEITRGFGFLQDVIIDQHYTQRARQTRLQKAVVSHPGSAGLGIDENTAVIFKGRDMHVIGSNQAAWVTVTSNGRYVESAIPSGTRDDLVRLMRAAYAPQSDKPRGRPLLARGSIMAVGGGRMDSTLAKRFVELAGGNNSLIVILPTAAPEESPAAQGASIQRLLQSGGGAQFKVLAGNNRLDIESAEYLDALAKAGGVWFGGGRQWRFVDAYEGTKFESALKGVLERGGVIGGSSAGATILGDYLCRGSPLGNTRMMTPGYERGFAFLPGVGIDQHFSQRQRFSDMELFCKEKPQFIGVGIDEGTAMIASPKGADVMGPGKVHVYHSGKPVRVYANGDAINLLP